MALAGNTAVAALKKDRSKTNFDVILMDVQMPEMDGLTTMIAFLRERDARRGVHTPVVVLTAHAMGGEPGTNSWRRARTATSVQPTDSRWSNWRRR